MSQKSITTFFKKTPLAKRRISEAENINTANAISQANDKKPKLDEESMDSGSKTSLNEQDGLKSSQSVCASDTSKEAKSLDSPMSKKIEMNRLSAELKLLSKNHPALHPSMGTTWFQALRNEFDKPYFKTLSKFLGEERSRSTAIFPKPEHVWTWTKECTVDDIKVVVIGQDPYHNPGQAHGLSFSVPVGVAPPPSLLNMYKELESDIEGFKKPGHGYLVGWARQGVLLLNAVLTVRCRSPNSHKDHGWEQLTDAVIRHLNASHEGLVFLLWGAYAQKKAEFLDHKRHHLLKTVHPSPLSASRGFFGCKHFSRCNQLLEDQGKTPIDWSSLPAE